MQPWFDPELFGTWFGILGGGVGGSLLGCLGALMGFLVPRGRGRPLVLGGLVLFLVIGLAMAGFGLAAWLGGQPYVIWFAPVLLGLLFASLCGVFIPMTRWLYAQAERRRLDAEALRHS
jgi:fatty acid desaturase